MDQISSSNVVNTGRRTEPWRSLCVMQLENCLQCPFLPPPPSLCSADRNKNPSVSFSHLLRSEQFHLSCPPAEPSNIWDLLHLFICYTARGSDSHVKKKESSHFILLFFFFLHSVNMGQKASLAEEVDETAEVLSTTTSKELRRFLTLFYTSLFKYRF